MSDVCLIRRVSIFSAFPALLLAALALPVSAAGFPNEDVATAAGQVMVATAATGGIDEAFKSAHAMSRPNDPVLASALEAHKQILSAQLGSLGVLHGRVQLVDASEFAGCARREYRVRYAGGEQHWFLKFRRASNGGWSLFALDVVGAPQN